MPLLSDANSRLAAARRLTDRRVRREHGRFLAEGAQAVREALASAEVFELFSTPTAAQRHPRLLQTAQARGICTSLISDKAATGLSETVHPQGIVAVCTLRQPTLAEVLENHPQFLVVLVQPNDPGNLGSVIRTADAVDADAVILVGDGVDPYNGKVVRATAGSLFHLPVIAGGSTEQVLAALSARQIANLATTGSLPQSDVDDLHEFCDSGSLPHATAWWFGNEAHGLPPAVIFGAEHRVQIPIYGRAESLNLSVAAGVCLYAAARARRQS